MADMIYNAAIADLMNGDLDLGGDDIRALLVKPTYVPDAGHDALDDIPAGDRIDSAVALTGESVSGGAFDAADVTFPTVTTALTAQAVVLYKHNASEALARLICYLDAIEGFPISTNGADIEIQWNNGDRKILRLGS